MDNVSLQVPKIFCLILRKYNPMSAYQNYNEPCNLAGKMLYSGV